MAERIAVFERQRLILESDCDSLGHVNNAVWVRFLSEVAEAHAAALGLDYADMAAKGLAWVARSHSVFYFGEAWPGQQIQEQTWVSLMKGLRCVRHYRFSDTQGNLLFRGDSEWIVVDAEKHRPCRAPASVIDAFCITAGDSASGPQL